MGALEEHVLKKMRKPGTQLFALMDTAGPHPDLDTDDGVRHLLLADDCETILQDDGLRFCGKEGFQWGG